MSPPRALPCEKIHPFYLHRYFYVATLAASVFDQYVGVYTRAPGITMTISRDGEKFLTQVTRQSLVEIFAEAEDKFFAVVVEAQIRFERGAHGKVSQLVLLQGGRETPAKRIR